jgi:hypothetical protein
MSDKTWKTQELLGFCRKDLTDDAAVYVASILDVGDRWKISQQWIQTVRSLPFLEKCLT